MKEGTREQLLIAARRVFAERGFYGASISLVAGELGLSKQALLYHFKRKEDLYGEVLREISERLLGSVREVLASSTEPEQQLEDVMVALYLATRERPGDTQILVRELIDNRSRASAAQEWYLRPFLDELVRIVRRVRGFRQAPDAELFCIVYQLLGSIEYFSISAATLQRMYGDAAFDSFCESFPATLRCQVRRLWSGPHDNDST
jgi:AcrR family transcriptional regulator